MESQRKASVLRRKEIVSAARKLIVEYGCDRLTVRRLAEEVGLTGGTLYKHFKSKKDVLSLLIDDIESTLCADLGDSMAHGDDPLQALEQTIDRVRERKGVSFHVLAEIITLGDAELNNKINRAVDSYIASIKRVLSEGINRGIIREDLDLDAAALMYFGTIQGLVSVWALSQYRFDLRTRYASLWALFREAVEKRRLVSP